MALARTRLLLSTRCRIYPRAIFSCDLNGLSNSKDRIHIAPITPVLCQRRNFSSEFYENYLSSENNAAIGFVHHLLENVHDVTGLPWWASIAVSVFTLRTLITLPVAIYSLKNMEKVAKLEPELKQLAKQLQYEVMVAGKKHNWDKKSARYKFNITMKKLVRDRYIRDNCHPLKSSLVVVTQIPLWVCMSFALRNMSGFVPFRGAEDSIPCPDLMSEGIFWFSNLAIPDSTFILPVILGALNLALVELNAYKTVNPTRTQRNVTNFFRFLSVLMVPVGAAVPSCMCWYWTMSTSYGLVQNLALKRPEVRRLFGLSIMQPKSSNDQNQNVSKDDSKADVVDKTEQK